MNLSKRLEGVAKMITNCDCLVDVGTDHGYIPSYAIKNNLCIRAIATDINQGPLNVAMKTFKRYKITDKVKLKLGPGLSVLKGEEFSGVVISGMGGNLIADIIKDDLDLARKAEYLILQPVQYPEVLRQFLSQNSFEIIDEDIVAEDNKFYHIIKVKQGEQDSYQKEVFYYTGNLLYDKKHPVLKEYIEFKINQLGDIIGGMPGDYTGPRKDELNKLKKEFEDVLKVYES